MPTETEISYLAGIIDGEGYIGIDSSYKRKNKPHNYQVRIGIANTNIKLLNWVKSIFGGWVGKKGKPKKSNHKQSYEWRLQAKKAEEIIKMIYPYLIIKKEQATIALKFRDTFGRTDSVIYIHKKGRFINSFPNPDLIPIRENLRKELLALNQRGTKSDARQA